MQDRFGTRLRAPVFLSTIVTLTLLVAACGGRGGQTAIPTPTLIPTLVAELPTLEPTAVPTVAPAETPSTKPAAEPSLEPTEGPVEEAAEEPAEEPTEEPSATPTVTPEAIITPEPEIAAGAEITETDAITDTGPVTATRETTGATETAASTELTTTAAITVTEDMAGTADVTGTVAITDSGEITATQPVTAGAELTGAESMVGGADMDHDAPAPVRVFFLQPTDNAVLPITSTVIMSYTGISLHHAGAEEETAHDEAENHDHAGALMHLHLLVDTGFTPPGEEIPEDEQHTHLMDGLTPVELVLTPGSHVLRLQIGDGDHIALAGDEHRAEIVVSVVDGALPQSVRIVSPTGGATVPPTFTVVMAATGLTVEPAGAAREDAGHLHLLVDTDFVEPGATIPVDETHLHFGKAQLTGTVTLEPGEHVLRLQFADGLHTALEGDQYHDEVMVNVVEGARATRIMFTEPQDGATVEAPFRVAWAAAGLIIEPAGQVLRPEGGHLHLLVDEDFSPAGEVIVADETHLHFGKAQTSAELSLEPGEHTLRLQMANGAHMAQDGLHYQDEITVTVE